MKLAICNDVFTGWSWAEVCREASACGYVALEVAPGSLGVPLTELDSTARQEMRAQAARYGLGICGLHWLLVGKPGLHLYNPTVQSITLPYLVELTRFCADMGGSVLVLGSPAQREIPPEIDRLRANELLVKTLRYWASVCHDYNVTLCLEPLGPAQADLIQNAAEAVALIDAVNAPGIALHLDVRALLTESVAPADVIRRYKAYLRHVHVNDAGMTPPGSGAAPYESIISTLCSVGYQGYLSVEVFDLLGQTPEQVAQSSAEFLRRVTTNLR